VVYLTVEVQVLAEEWRIEYNTYRPHGSLDFVTHEAFRQHWLTKESTTQPTLSQPMAPQPGSSQVRCGHGLGYAQGDEDY